MKLLSALYHATDPFLLFDDCIGIVDKTHLSEFDPADSVLLLWGGADISTSYYKQSPSVYTTARFFPSKRDWQEAQMIDHAVEVGMPIIGICRGAQFLCAKAGGSLVQHLSGHEGNHHITTKEGRTLLANSTHHQMMLPDESGEVLAWATTRQSKDYWDGDGEMAPPEKEVEAVWWSKWKALGIQGHPEYMTPSSSFVGYCQQLVKEYILK